MNILADTISLTGWTSWAGLAGIGLYIIAYAMLQLGFLRADTYTFCAMNALAGVGVLFGLTGAFNVWTALIQLLWIGLSLIGAVRLWLDRRTVAFDTEEAAYLKRALPKLPKPLARDLMDLAHVMSIDAGTELTTQGEEITHLAYMLEGDAEVIVQGHPVASLGPGAYIGEVTYADAQPASATVILSSPAVIVSFEIDTLRSFLDENPGVQPHLEHSAANNLRAKLRAANARIVENEMNRALAAPESEADVPQSSPAEGRRSADQGSDPFFGSRTPPTAPQSPSGRPPKIKEVV
ncbi:MAG: cyclic nucleotide-binding domain-containing protein [Pseudomonadota bacterium]